MRRRIRLSERTGAALAAVSLGATFGALARYGVTEAVPAGPGTFPWAVFGVNVAGCLGIGALMATIAAGRVRHPLARPFWGIGVLGGFTTFSTYAADTRSLVAHQAYGTAVGYCLGSVAAGLLAVWLGTKAPVRP
ncbi:chromosome condensation protein CrcB [Wenjunlia vitaminophila]|uniref:Fluoride-specific ion channel FluC n=1 Tax=Wenjunlia vitaminophila TaxID=76728 RepID=A0A0T6LQN5_WENVI|nr:fluoride efflux transporter CrcB [Wenjunlia vitaminophila]KRV48439.1 chromosome condensation protein CrcB [Wenjunlia vitaminophila]